MANGDTQTRHLYNIPPGVVHTDANPTTLVTINPGTDRHVCLRVSIVAKTSDSTVAFGWVGRVLVSNQGGSLVHTDIAGDAIDPSATGWTVTINSGGQIQLAAASGVRSWVDARGIEGEQTSV